MFSLQKNVFIVRGAFNHAIYNLNDGKLYQIDNEFLYLIEKAINCKDCEFSKKEKNIINSLISKDILVRSEHRQDEKPITSLRVDSKPNFAWLEITQQCNLKCVFCYEESDCHNKKHMTMEDFHKARKFLINYGIKEIQFIGGEPMIHPQLKEMIESCLGDFDFIEVYTNGTFITQEWCDFFKENNIKVAISLHSFIPEEVDKITQTKGAYKMIKRGIDLVLKNNLSVRFATIENKDVKIGEPAKDFPVRAKTQPPRLIGRGAFDQFDYNMFKKVVITKDTFTKPINKDFVIRAVSGHQCFNKDLYIAYNLEIFPCVMERRISHGFIKDENDLSIIKSSICKCNKDFIEECKHCEFRYLCHDCRPNCNGGGVMDKPWHCSYDPETGKWEGTKKMFNRLKKEAS